MMKSSLLVLALSSCWTSSTSTVSQPTSPDVMVELAAVTLGDDCGGAVPPPVAGAAPSATPLVASRPAKPAPYTPAGAPMPPGDICEGCSYTPHCDQTSMQLSLKATAGAGTTSIKVKRVELLDSRGKRIADLTSRAPTRWNGDAYEAWNQSIDAGQRLSASYTLTAPNWDELTGGRWNAHTKTFQLRVTLTVGSKDRTVDKQSITPALLEPPVPT